LDNNRDAKPDDASNIVFLSLCTQGVTRSAGA